MKTKNEVYVVVDTPKKAKKVKEVLDMFGEELDKTDESAIKMGYYCGSVNLYTEINKLYFTGNNWSLTELCENKTEVSIKKLKKILAKEHFEVGKWYVIKWGKLKALIFNIDNIIGYGLPWSGEWTDVANNSPSWLTDTEYRIKPDDKPQVGDVCKFWNGSTEDSDGFIISIIQTIHHGDDIRSPYKAKCGGMWFRCVKKLTQQEVIDLLFNNK